MISIIVTRGRGGGREEWAWSTRTLCEESKVVIESHGHRHRHPYDHLHTYKSLWPFVTSFINNTPCCASKHTSKTSKTAIRNNPNSLCAFQKRERKKQTNSLRKQSIWLRTTHLLWCQCLRWWTRVRRKTECISLWAREGGGWFRKFRSKEFAWLAS